MSDVRPGVRPASSVEPGQTWRCNEALVEGPDAPEPHDDVDLWESHLRFAAVVDSVQGDYVELTVTRSNGHPLAPDHGAEIVASAETLDRAEKWSRLGDDAAPGREVADAV